MTEVLDRVPKSYSKQVAVRVLNNTKRVTQAAGAEAGQEYLQTWHEILAAKMDSASLASAIEEVKKGGNIDQSFFGFLAGGAAGGITKGVISTPGLVTGVALDTAVGTVQSTAQFVKDKSIDASFKVLSEKERADLKKTYDKEVAVHEEVSKIRTAKIDELKNAASIADVKDEESLNEIKAIQEAKNITDESLKDPEVFKAITNALQAKFKAAIATDKTILEGSDLARAAKRSIENVTKGTVDTIKKAVDTVVTPETVEKAKAIAKTVSDAAVDVVTNFSSTAAAGLIVAGSEYSKNKTRKQLNAIKKIAEDVELEDLQSATKILKKAKLDPRVETALNSIIDKKTRALASFTPDKKEINKNSIPTSIQAVIAGDKITKDNGRVIAGELHNAITNSRIADMETLNAVRKAFKAYRASPHYNSNEAGSISATDMAKLHKQLVAHHKKLNKVSKTVKVATKVGKTVGKATIKGVTTVAKKVGSVTKKAATDAFESAKDYVESNKTTIEEAIDNLGDLADTAVNKTTDLIDSVTNLATTKKLQKLDQQITNSANVAEIMSQLPEIIQNLIESGITTKEDFVKFLSEAAPKLSALPGISDVIVKGYEKALKAFQTDADADTLTATVEEADTIDQKLNGNTEEDIADNRIPDNISDEEAKAQLKKMGIDIC